MRSDWKGSSFWVLLSNLAQAGGTFLALLLISRVSGLEAAGKFAYAQAIAAPVAQLLSFQLKALVLTHRVDELTLGSAAALRTATSGLGVALAFAFAVFCNPLTGILFAAKLTESWGELFQADYQRRSQSVRAAVTSCIRAGLLLASLAFSPSVEMGLAIYFLASVAVVCGLEWGDQTLNVQFDLPALGLAWKLGSILGVVLFLQTLQASIPRIVLGQYSEAASLGAFATLCVTLQMGNLIASSYGQSLMPAFGSASNAVIGRRAGAVLLCGAALLLPLYLLRETVLSALRVPVDALATETLIALSCVQLVVWPATVIGYALTARRLYHQQVWIAVVLNAVSLVSSLVLIPSMGAAGAAYVLGLSALTMLASSAIVLTADAKGESARPLVKPFVPLRVPE